MTEPKTSTAPKASYRFVPLNSRVIPAPLRLDQISHARPLPGCWSGGMTVEWRNETPICVGAPGQDKDDSVDSPFCLPGQRYALPGPSLKGMIRAVVEIATFSHLGRINDHHRFGYRDFNDQEHYRQHVKPNDLKAGWLRYDQKSGQWQLAAAKGERGFAMLPIDLLLEAIDKKVKREPGINEAKKKRDIIAKAGFGPHVISYEHKAKHGSGVNIVSALFDAVVDKKNTGVIVCADTKKKADPTPKKGDQKFEAIFHEPGEFKALPPDYMERFAFLHSKMTKSAMEPEGNWKTWLKGMGYPNPLNAGGKTEAPQQGYDFPGIPVYYCGQPPVDGRTEDDGFHMGFSRVIKIPYEFSVGQLAQRTLGRDGEKYSIPELGRELDFARAIFGDVEGSLPSERKKAADGPDRLALKGRVAFEFATLAEGRNPYLMPVSTTVMMGPKASFWPFYLRNGQDPGSSADYNDEMAILAGRKRYPVRCLGQQLPKPPADAKEKQKTKLRFLGAGHVFRGRIRFRNLHAAELGALLWALNFGDFSEPTKYFHAMGRAKGHGYGRLAATISQFRATAHCPAGQAIEARDMAPFVEEFTAYMDAGLRWLGYGFGFENSPAVTALRALADPQKSKNNDQHLGVMSMKDFRTLKRIDQAHDLLCDYVSADDWARMRP